MRSAPTRIFIWWKVLRHGGQPVRVLPNFCFFDGTSLFYLWIFCYEAVGSEEWVESRRSGDDRGIPSFTSHTSYCIASVLSQTVYQTRLTAKENLNILQ